MRLTLIAVLCTAFASLILASNVNFDKPEDPVEIPKIFQTRMRNFDLQNYSLAIEAVMSVALKLQAIDDRNGKQQNFLVSPLAVASALGQLMLGTTGELQKQIAILLTLHDDAQYMILDGSSVNVGGRISNTANTTTARPITAENAWAYEGNSLQTRRFDPKHRNGLPSLELHRQLGRLILDLSMSLPEPGHPQSLTNSSYLHMSSAFFVDQDIQINEPFVRAIADFYEARVVPLDFRNKATEAQNTVNDWGSTHTGGLISKFLAYPPPADTAVIQAVAVHFRGAWQAPFVPEGTFSGLFKTSETGTVPVEFMRGSFEDAFYAENKTLGVRLLAMPYAQCDSAMYVVLPMDTHSLRYNISHLISQLSTKDLANLVAKATKRTVNVLFPKFALSSSLNLASALAEHAAYLNKQKIERTKNMGNIVNRFNPMNQNLSSTAPLPFPNGPPEVISLEALESASDARSSQVSARDTQDSLVMSRNSGPVSEPGVNGYSQGPSPKSTLIIDGAAADSRFRVSDIIQQIALEVNEAGTEAAAIAGSTVNYSGDVKNFKVNRPFLFFIRHEATGAMLFWGTIVDPSA